MFDQNSRLLPWNSRLLDQDNNQQIFWSKQSTISLKQSTKLSKYQPLPFLSKTVDYLFETVDYFIKIATVNLFDQNSRLSLWNSRLLYPKNRQCLKWIKTVDCFLKQQTVFFRILAKQSTVLQNRRLLRLCNSNG